MCDIMTQLTAIGKTPNFTALTHRETQNTHTHTHTHTHQTNSLPGNPHPTIAQPQDCHRQHTEGTSPPV